MGYKIKLFIKTRCTKQSIFLLTLSLLSIYIFHFYSRMGYFPFSREAFIVQRPFKDFCKCPNLSVWASYRHQNSSPSQESLCSDSATGRGLHQKVISFSLFLSPKNSYLPSNSVYFNGIRVNVEKARIFYPEWQIRIYTYSHRHFNHYLCDLTCTNPEVFICDIENLPNIGSVANQVDSAMWRFLPLIDPTVDIFISRDLDSTFSSRELAAVNQWIESNKTFHSMRDHPWHKELLLAGLWGSKTSKMKNYFKSIFKRTIFTHGSSKGNFFQRGYDQTFLGVHLYRLIKNDLITHDSYFCQEFLEAVPFPVQRQNSNDFVGNYISRPNRFSISKKCPLACRPLNGKNWTYC